MYGNYEIRKPVSGAKWWCLFFCGTQIDTFDRKWQAVEAIERYKAIMGVV